MYYGTIGSNPDYYQGIKVYYGDYLTASNVAPACPDTGSYDRLFLSST